MNGAIAESANNTNNETIKRINTNGANHHFLSAIINANISFIKLISLRYNYLLLKCLCLMP